MNDTIKIFQALEDFNTLLKGVTKTFKNETKEQRGGFWSMFMLSGPLGAVSKEICQQENELQYLFEEKNGIFNATSSFKKHWNAKILSRWTKI